MARSLDLLVVFDAIATAGSITGAAQRLSLSQPAVSHALNRLRDKMADPLFTRAGGGLVMTETAKRMEGPVRELVAGAERLMIRDAFVPSSDRRHFRIAASDYAALTIVPQLLRELRKSAPHVTLEFLPIGPDTLSQMERGTLDLSFWGTTPPAAPFMSLPLFEECYAGLVCARHPLVKGLKGKTPTLEQYLAYPYVAVSMRDPGRNAVDEALRLLGKKRDLAVTTHSFIANMQCLKNSDLVATQPARLCEGELMRGLVSFNLPLQVPAYTYSTIWHRRSDGDAASAWLRQMVRASC